MGLEYLMQQLELGEDDGCDFFSCLLTKAVDEYHKTNSSQDLELAIACARKLVAITEENSPHWAEQTANLGVVLIYRYERDGAINDLEEATSVTRQAVTATPDDHSDYPSWLNNLGIIYNHRFDFTGAMPDLEQAIDLFRQAITTSTHEQPDFVVWGNTLAYLLCIHYEKMGRPRYIDEAIDLGRQVVLATSEEDPGYPARLYNLGLSFDLRFKRTGITEDLIHAIFCIGNAIDAETSSARADWPEKLDELIQELYRNYPTLSTSTRAEDN
ncbi:hypothetical protein H9Q72_012933 [Fusarium xylarioides]|uniref:MalT-like TPR region domain-containing protein n=1 Tax=Fusarium xylarioides TaxID=221167 RepID=A0A9P7HDR0_9HYPO|nr:hypothetical protein H9Q70_013026 [Fusarium xylarioides]KAG5758934.1 hypothetical protein H9Q72_012933 [Fusarium xylarioides]KAG5777837.1 hypothetical protein H9Q73_008505 [Fusarium xylarioides]